MPPQKKKSQKAKIILGLLVSLICLVWVFRSVEQEEVFRNIRSARLDYLFWAVVLTTLSYLLRALRWPYFFKLRPPAFVDSFRCLIVGFFMNNVLPARIGELVRAHLGGRATKQSRTYVLATIAGERLVDGVTISALFVVLFSFFATAVERSEGREIFYVAYFFGFAAVAVVCVLIIREYLFRLLTRLGAILPGHLSNYTLVRVRRFIEGLEPMMMPRRLLAISIWSVTIWSVELLVYAFVAKAFHQELSIGAIGLFLAAVNFSSLIPAAPGGIGVIEAFATLALNHIGIDREIAFVMVATQHLIQFAVVGIPGLIFSVTGTVHPSEISDSDENAEVDAEDLGVETLASGPVSTAEIGDKTTFSVGRVSVVIPSFNEELRLPSTLKSIFDFFEQQGSDYEVIVVDDGSSDKTSDVARDFGSRAPRFKLLRYDRNQGKGYAVRLGMMEATGERILYNDADGASPIYEIERLEAALRNGADVAIGSRAMFSRDTAVQTVWYRKFMGRVFNASVNFLVLPGIADTQCGFKLFTRSAARYIFSRQTANRFSFDVEILFLARKAGFRIAEVPINWTNVPGSKVSLVKDSCAMFIDVVRFRVRDMFGGYNHAPDKRA